MNYDSRAETQEHIYKVQDYLYAACWRLEERAKSHDRTKLHEPELEYWNEYTPKLAQCEYPSQEYTDNWNALKPALDHHFEHNDHHPEHYSDGISGMSLLSLLEMLCDWKAASERTKRRADGDLYLEKNFEESLAYNQKRFGYSDELAGILRNTAHEMGMI